MIFPWLWKVLPGNSLGKTIGLLLLASLLAALLFLFVFPELSGLLTDSPLVEGR